MLILEYLVSLDYVSTNMWMQWNHMMTWL